MLCYAKGDAFHNHAGSGGGGGRPLPLISPCPIITRSHVRRATTRDNARRAAARADGRLSRGCLLTRRCCAACVRRGKRKRAKPPPKKAKPKVAQIFDCPFCGKTSSCACKMDIEHKLGTILCDACGAKYSMRISQLTDPIDVYSEWIDSALRCTLRAHIATRKKKSTS